MLAELFQPTHLLIILAVVVLLFGGRWFASLGNGFRDALKNFRHATKSSTSK
jgi:sec-independent protein translocase protein TatA